MKPLEIIAALLGLANVGLTVRRHILCWPFGIVMVVLYAYVFYVEQLYSDMLLQVVFFFLQLYGWYAWLRGGPDETPLVVSRLPAWQMPLWLAAGIVGTAALGSIMYFFTDASFPFVDALATVASLIAQWFLGRKILESWPVWVFVDVVSIPLYSVKGMYPTAVLYSVFLCMALWGWYEWRSAWRKQATALC